MRAMHCEYLYWASTLVVLIVVLVVVMWNVVVVGLEDF